MEAASRTRPGAAWFKSERRSSNLSAEKACSLPLCSSFSLPRLRGRVRVGADTRSALAEEARSEEIKLTFAGLPPGSRSLSSGRALRGPVGDPTLGSWPEGRLSPASRGGKEGQAGGDERRGTAFDEDSFVDFSITISSRPSMCARRSSRNKMQLPFLARRLPVVRRRQSRPHAARSRG